MNDAVAMRLVEGVSNLDGILHGRGDRERTAHQPIRQRFALEQRHDNEVDAVLVAHVVERADMRVRERRDRTCFALKALAKPGIVRRLLRKDFERDGPIQPRVARAIHLAHASGAERRDDLIGAESHARGRLIRRDSTLYLAQWRPAEARPVQRRVSAPASPGP